MAKARDGVSRRHSDTSCDMEGRPDKVTWHEFKMKSRIIRRTRRGQRKKKTEKEDDKKRRTRRKTCRIDRITQEKLLKQVKIMQGKVSPTCMHVCMYVCMYVCMHVHIDFSAL